MDDELDRGYILSPEQYPHQCASDPTGVHILSYPVRVYVKLLSHSGKSEIPKQINTNYRLDN
jgi:hypothetical protein